MPLDGLGRGATLLDAGGASGLVLNGVDAGDHSLAERVSSACAEGAPMAASRVAAPTAWSRKQFRVPTSFLAVWTGRSQRLTGTVQRRDRYGGGVSLRGGMVLKGRRRLDQLPVSGRHGGWGNSSRAQSRGEAGVENLHVPGRDGEIAAQCLSDDHAIERVLVLPGEPAGQDGIG